MRKLVAYLFYLMINLRLMAEICEFFWEQPNFCLNILAYLLVQACLPVAAHLSISSAIASSL